MTTPGADWTVERFLRTMVVPRRHREPRVADALQGSAPAFVDTRWGPVATWRHGEGSAILLVHGFEDDHSLWSPLIDVLVDRNRSFIAFDLPGHGASEGDWCMSFEGTDAIAAVAGALGPIDAVVAHSAGCGMTTAAIGEGLSVERAVFLAPPLGVGDRWVRKAAELGVPDDIASAAKTVYFDAIGPQRSQWQARAAYLELDLDLLIIHSRDDERFPFSDTNDVMSAHPRADVVLVHGVSHRRTARDPGVISVVADFVTSRSATEPRTRRGAFGDVGSKGTPSA